MNYRTYLLCSFVGAVSLSAQTFSSFDFDDEGWLVAGDSTSGSPTYNATGGNPGGFLSAADSVSGGVWYWSAPSKFLGNQSGATTGSLSFELAQSNTGGQFDASDVIIDGAGLSLHYNTLANPATVFTEYTIDLTTTSGWKVSSLTGADVTEVQFDAVFADITGLRIRGEFRSGADTGWLDNVSLTSVVIPEPSAMSFFVGLLGLAGLRRRRR